MGQLRSRPAIRRRRHVRLRSLLVLLPILLGLLGASGWSAAHGRGPVFRGLAALRRALPAWLGPSWTSYGGGPSHTFAVLPSALTPTSVAHLAPAWHVRADGEVEGDPVLAGGRVFFGSFQGTLYAADASSGRVLWQRRLDGTPLDGGPLEDQGRLYVSTSGGRMFSLDPRNGRTLWESAPLFTGVDDAVRASPELWQGILYQSLGGQGDSQGEQGGVVAVDERTGRILWRTLLVHYVGGGAAVFGPPVVIPQLGELVVGTGNPTPFPGDNGADGPVPDGSDPDADSLVALSLKTGRVIWTAQAHTHDGADLDFIAAPNVVQLADGGLAVGDGSKDGEYHLVDAVTGKPLWSTSLIPPATDTLIVATAAVSEGRIFVGTMDVSDADAASNWPGNYQQPGTGHLVALDASSGRVLWSDPLPSTIAAAPLASPGLVLTLEADGTLLAVDATSGRAVWSTKVPGQVWNAEAAPALAGRTLLLPLANPGGLAAYRLTG